MLFAVALWLAALLYVVGSLRLGTMARVLPLVGSIPTLALLSVNVALEFRHDRRGDPAAGPAAGSRPHPAGAAQHRHPDAAAAGPEGRAGLQAPAVQDTVEDPRSEWRMLAWVGALVATTLLLGFAVAFPTFLAAFLRVRGGEPWRWSLLITGGLLAFLVVFFGYLLKLSAYPGWFGPALTF